jgi:asparaginyl-tRNA synthetase
MAPKEAPEALLNEPVARIKDLLALSEAPGEPIAVKGWVRTRRDGKGVSFLELNDGSCLANLQAVVEEGSEAYEGVKDLATGSAAELFGRLIESRGQGQKFELAVESFFLAGPSGPDYPLQKKRHSDEFLRDIAHLRPRTNKFGAMARIRSECAFAVHEFFRSRGFYYVHTPIITGSDAEGAGEMFKVTTREGPGVGGSEDFFGKPACLTVSGQLEAEAYALALGRVYTFGPTFRAENSNTARHAAEFWMIEPEAAFFDLYDDMDLAEAMVRSLVKSALERSHDDLALFDRFVDPGLITRLEALAFGPPYARLTHKAAVSALLESGQKFEMRPREGADLFTEHEKFLCEIAGGPVIVYDYPAAIKPFYMRLSDDRQTVAAMDLLAPRVGELIGGSQREERLGVLAERMDELGLPARDYWWYLDLRRWGSAPHSGFGLGFERFLMALTGTPNIRDTLPFPRTPGKLEF